MRDHGTLACQQEGCQPSATGGLFSPAMQLQEFVKEHGIKTLNVAGSRESKESGIHDWVMQVLCSAFFDP